MKDEKKERTTAQLWSRRQKLTDIRERALAELQDIERKLLSELKGEPHGKV